MNKLIKNFYKPCPIDGETCAWIPIIELGGLVYIRECHYCKTWQIRNRMEDKFKDYDGEDIIEGFIESGEYYGGLRWTENFTPPTEKYYEDN